MSDLIRSIIRLLSHFHRAGSPERGNAVLPTVIILGGAAAIGMQAMYGDIFQNLQHTKLELARTAGTQNNVSAIKMVENLTQPAAAGAYDSSHPASFPVLYPKPYTGVTGDPALMPVGSSKGGTGWSFGSGKITVNIPLLGQTSGDQMAEAFNSNKPLASNGRPVVITSLRPVYSTDPNKSPYVIEGYEVTADHNDGLKANHTAALIKLPPPPAPTCEVSLDNKNATYRPSALVTGTVTINGVALKARIPSATDAKTGQPTYSEIITVSRKQSIDDKYVIANFQLAAPRPLPVVDGSKTTEETITAEVVGLNNELRECSATYLLALPPTCGLMASKYVLARGECVKLSILPLPQTAQTKFSGDISHLTNGSFCMDAAASDGQSFKVTATASSKDGSSDCGATFVADVPTSDTSTSHKETSTSHKEKCPYLTGAKKTDLSFFVNYQGNAFYAKKSFDLSSKNIFEVPVMSRSQTDSWICPASSRCYALQNDGSNRNLFVELRLADTAQCTPIPIDRLSLGCFAENTKVATSKSTDIKIAKLNVGDQVFNPITGTQAAIERITVGPEILPMVVIHSDDRQLKVTTEHPMLTSRGLIMAELLQPGDRIMYGDGSLHAVTRVESAIGAEGATVRNFVIHSASTNPADHMVLADGIVTGDLYLQTKLNEEMKSRRLAAH